LMPSSATVRPGGELVTVSGIWFASIITLFVSLRPMLSYAVSCSSRLTPCPWSGITKLPLSPLDERNGCVWHVLVTISQWCRIIVHWSWSPVSAPSSSSTALPE
jgi:hypothetical protein